MPLPLAIARAMRIRRQLNAARAGGSSAAQLLLLAERGLWHRYKPAAQTIARFPRLQALLHSRGWL